MSADLTQAMGSHQSSRSGSGVWLTPLNLIRDLGPFDLDPCGHDGWPTAERMYCPPQDGLNLPWTGRVFLNPPYSQVWDWLARLAAHGDGIALVFARTETAWFVDHVWGRATALRFLHGRLHFYHPEGYRAHHNAGAPSVLVAYGDRNADALRGIRDPRHLPADRKDPPVTDLEQIRERAEADYVTDPDTVTSDLAKDLMQARLDRQALLDLIDRGEEEP